MNFKILILILHLKILFMVLVAPSSVMPNCLSMAKHQERSLNLPQFYLKKTPKIKDFKTVLLSQSSSTVAG